MTKDEIKASRSMTDVIGMYGFRPNRQGFICCPFHKEKTASMKINKDKFHCFGCGQHGDIFAFVQLVEQCDFKTAFKVLGGSYQGKTERPVIRKIEYNKRLKATEENQKNRLLKEYIEACEKLHFYQKAVDYAPRDSEIYATALKETVYLEYIIEEIDKELVKRGRK